jgi:hypothetical protein
LAVGVTVGWGDILERAAILENPALRARQHIGQMNQTLKTRLNIQNPKSHLLFVH